MLITDDQRRRLLVSGQLALDGLDVLAATRRLVALHATDAPSVYLALLARVPGTTIAQIAAELERGDLVRVLAMRRTLFVVDRDDVPVVHAAASAEVGRRLRTQLVAELTRRSTEPPVADPEGFLAGVEREVLDVLLTEPLDGNALSRAVPGLRTVLLPTEGKKWDLRRTLTSPVLAMLSARGVVVRGQPDGSWTSNRHRWERADGRFPGGVPVLDEADARVELARAYLAAFGPATVADLAWWTGWPLGRTRQAVAALDTIPVVLDAGDGVMLATTDPDAAPTTDGHVALLPSLDPTTMGWKHRDWYLGPYRSDLFDTAGNAGPTIWADGRIVGAWAVRDGGEIAYRLLEDVGTDLANAVDAEAGRLTGLLDGASFRAGFPTPLYRELRA